MIAQSLEKKSKLSTDFVRNDISLFLSTSSLLGGDDL